MTHVNLAPWVNTLDVGDKCYVSWNAGTDVRYVRDAHFPAVGGDYFSYLGHDEHGLHFARKGAYIVLDKETLNTCRKWLPV